MRETFRANETDSDALTTSTTYEALHRESATPRKNGAFGATLCTVRSSYNGCVETDRFSEIFIR